MSLFEGLSATMLDGPHLHIHPLEAQRLVDQFLAHHNQDRHASHLVVYILALRFEEQFKALGFQDHDLAFLLKIIFPMSSYFKLLASHIVVSVPS